MAVSNAPSSNRSKPWTDDTDDEAEMERVHVAVRIRPKLDHVAEERFDSVCAVRSDVAGDGARAVVSIIDRDAGMGSPLSAKDGLSFGFDHVFDDCDSQQAVYDELVRPHFISTLDGGSDMAVIAYGQTGSGKSYSMLGGRSMVHLDEECAAIESDVGVFHRLLQQVASFRKSQRSQGFDVVVALTAVELYNDQVYDLLAPAKPPVAFRETSEDLLLTNPTIVNASDREQLQTAMLLAARNRVVASTAMNNVSSRSHALFFVDVFRRIIRREPRADGGGPDGMDPALLYNEYSKVRAEKWASQSNSGGGASSSRVPASSVLFGVLRSRFALVDLAGNERLKRSAVVGNQLNEALFVNKSLSAFGTVVHAIATGVSFIPFRDSKLTRLLRPALASVKSRTIVLVTISPVSGNSQDSVMSLRFASRLKALPAIPPQSISRLLTTNEAEGALLDAQRSMSELVADLNVVAFGYGYKLQGRHVSQGVEARHRYALPMSPVEQQAARQRWRATFEAADTSPSDGLAAAVEKQKALIDRVWRDELGNSTAYPTASATARRFAAREKDVRTNIVAQQTELQHFRDESKRLSAALEEECAAAERAAASHALNSVDRAVMQRRRDLQESRASLDQAERTMDENLLNLRTRSEEIAQEAANQQLKAHALVQSWTQLDAVDSKLQTLIQKYQEVVSLWLAWSTVCLSTHGSAGVDEHLFTPPSAEAVSREGELEALLDLQPRQPARLPVADRGLSAPLSDDENSSENAGQVLAIDREHLKTFDAARWSKVAESLNTSLHHRPFPPTSAEEIFAAVRVADDEAGEGVTRLMQLNALMAAIRLDGDADLARVHAAVSMARGCSREDAVWWLTTKTH